MYIDRIGEDEQLGKGEFIKFIIVFSLVWYVLISHLFLLTVVSGSSMENTLHDGEYYYSSVLTMHALGPKRSDIVVIKFKDVVFEDDDYIEKDKYLVKRLIGLPGDRIDIIGGQTYLNEEKLEESYALKAGEDEIEYYLDGSWQLGEDEYFVMGDNRLPYGSYDSRSFGPIKKEELKSILRFRIYLINDFLSFLKTK